MKIVTHKKDSGSSYIHSMKLNGRAYKSSFIHYADLVKGGVLEIYLEDKPDKKWAAKAGSRPSGLAKKASDAEARLLPAKRLSAPLQAGEH